MELRVLEYFLAVAREESITAAANALHLSQPTLSRQLKDMEDELGKQLFIRGSKKIELTDEGKLLRKRAQEIVQLVNKTKGEISTDEGAVTGDVYIGACETDGTHIITDAAKRVTDKYPEVRFHIISGDDKAVEEMLDNEIIDIGIVLDNVDYKKYDSIKTDYSDNWGVLVKKDSPLAACNTVKTTDLYNEPLIVSRQILGNGVLKTVLGRGDEELNIAATYNLLYNGAQMVKSGLGYAICIDGIINTSGDSELAFIPIEPPINTQMHIILKKGNIFSKAAQALIDELK